MKDFKFVDPTFSLMYATNIADPTGEFTLVEFNPERRNIETELLEQANAAICELEAANPPAKMTPAGDQPCSVIAGIIDNTIAVLTVKHKLESLESGLVSSVVWSQFRSRNQAWVERDGVMVNRVAALVVDSFMGASGGELVRELSALIEDTSIYIQTKRPHIGRGL